MGTRGTKGTRSYEAGLGLGAPSPPQVTSPCPGLGTGVRGRGGGDVNNSSGPAGMSQPGAAGGEGQGVLPPPFLAFLPPAAPRAPRAPPGRCCIPPAEGSSRPRSGFSARSSPRCPFPTPASGGGGGGAGSWGRKEDKKGGKKTNTHPPKKPSPAAAGTPPSPPVLGPVRLRRVGEPTLRVAGCTRGAVQRHTWTIRTVHTQTRTHVRTHIDTRGDTRAHGETRPRVGLGGGVPTAPSKSLRIPSRCSFTESRAMGEEGGGTRGRPAWEPQSGAEPERSSGTGRDGGGCPGLCGRGAGGGGGGGERAGGGGEGCRGRGRRGEVLPAPRPGRIPPYPYPTGVASPGGSGGSRPLRPPSRCCGSFPPESRGQSWGSPPRPHRGQ